MTVGMMHDDVMDMGYVVRCTNPKCDHYDKPKVIQAQYLANGVYQALAPKCAVCMSGWEMRIDSQSSKSMSEV